MVQVKCLSYLSTFLLIFLSVAQSVIASPTNIVSTVLHAPPPEISAYQPSHAHTSPIHSTEPATSSPPIYPRTDDYEVLPISSLNPGWELDFYEFDWGYLPLSSASIILQAFYNRIIELATSTPDPMPEHRARPGDRGVPWSGRVGQCGDVCGAHVADCAKRVYEQLSLSYDQHRCWGLCFV